MGAGGKANHNTKIIVARSLDPKYYPNSKIGRCNSRGVLVQERWYASQE